MKLTSTVDTIMCAIMLALALAGYMHDTAWALEIVRTVGWINLVLALNNLHAFLNMTREQVMNLAMMPDKVVECPEWKILIWASIVSVIFALTGSWQSIAWFMYLAVISYNEYRIWNLRKLSSDMRMKLEVSMNKALENYDKFMKLSELPEEEQKEAYDKLMSELTEEIKAELKEGDDNVHRDDR